MGGQISSTNLILNSDGSIYHLKLLPEEIADTIILVGDPQRVALVSRYFQSIEYIRSQREFISHTGQIGSKRISVISTGIGTDNIDIVINELDSLANIDFKTRQIKEHSKQLNLIRIGTSGACNESLPIGSFVVSKFAIGLDNLMVFYSQSNNPVESSLLTAFRQHMGKEFGQLNPYAAESATSLMHLFNDDCKEGITITLPGFYGPQSRQLRAPIRYPNFISRLRKFQFQQWQATNLEMETAGLYALGKLLGHHCCSLNAIINNRAADIAGKDNQAAIIKLIELTLEKLTPSNQ